MDRNYSVTIITKNPWRNKGILENYYDIFTDIINNRGLIFSLFSRDLKNIFQQSCLGIAWTIFLPICYVSVFILLYSSGIVNFGNSNVSYPLYITLGFAFWNFFSIGLPAAINSLPSAGILITKTNVSKKAIILSSQGQALISFFVQFILFIILAIIIDVKYLYTIPIVLLFLVPIISFSLGLGLFFSIINVYIRDIANIVGVLIYFGFFLTPIFYTTPNFGTINMFIFINPITYLIGVPRQFLLQIPVTDVLPYLIAVILSFFLLFIGLFFFHINEDNIGDKL